MEKIDDFILSGFQRAADFLAAWVSPYRIAAVFHCVLPGTAIWLFCLPDDIVDHFLLGFLVFFFIVRIPYKIEKLRKSEQAIGVVPACRYKDKYWRISTVFAVIFNLLLGHNFSFKIWAIQWFFLSCSEYFSACIYTNPPPKFVTELVAI